MSHMQWRRVCKDGAGEHPRADGDDPGVLDVWWKWPRRSTSCATTVAAAGESPRVQTRRLRVPEGIESGMRLRVSGGDTPEMARRGTCM